MSKDIDQLRELHESLGRQYAHHITTSADIRRRQREIDRQIAKAEAGAMDRALRGQNP